MYIVFDKVFYVLDFIKIGELNLVGRLDVFGLLNEDVVRVFY